MMLSMPLVLRLLLAPRLSCLVIVSGKKKHNHQLSYEMIVLPVCPYAYSYLLTVHVLFTERSSFTHGLGELEIA